MIGLAEKTLTDHFGLAIREIMRYAKGMDFDLSQVYIAMSFTTASQVFWCYAGIGNISELQRQQRYEEYLSRMALPIYGRWYPVILNDDFPEGAIRFAVTGDGSTWEITIT